MVSGHILLAIDISLDGDKWCALVGENIQEGLTGFGDNPTEAIRQLTYEMETYGYSF